MQSYHAECVGVPEPVAKCFLKNVLWLCDGCLDMCTDYFAQQICGGSKTDNIEMELSEIKEKIANITEALSTVLPLTSSTSRKDATNPTHYHVRHSTPVSTTLNCGSRSNGSTNADCLSFEQADSSFRGKRENAGTFPLFLTNIDCSVTEQEVTDMIEQSLGSEINEKLEMKIIKLVPKWKDPNCLKYTSFKIVLDQGLKRKALQPNTWPVGVLFREFVEHPRRTWTPTRS